MTFFAYSNQNPTNATSSKTIRNIHAVLLITLLSFTLSGCASVKEILGFVTKIEMTLVASDDVNPDREGRPSPLVVRLYEFEDVKAFKEADFFALYDNENETIGKYILAKEEVNMHPDSTHKIKRRTKPEAKYIGILAAYRDLDNANWRAIVELREERTATVEVTLGKINVSVTKK